MEFLTDIFFGSSTAHAIMILALVITIGMALAKVRVCGLSLGSTWVLFAGILVAELGIRVDDAILGFARDFGLILFVFSLGLQIGPGFFSSLRQGGIRLMWLSLLVMILGGIVTYVIHLISDTPLQTLVGIMDGATANTPAMGATQQAYMDCAGTDDASIPLSFAISYPFGIVVTIIAFILLRYILRIDFGKETEAYNALRSENTMAAKYSIEIKNEQLSGQTVGYIRKLIARPFVISRISHDNQEAFIADESSPLFCGDKIFVVSSHEDKPAILAFLGSEIQMLENEWGKFSGALVSRRIVITRPEINGKRFSDLRLRTKYGINITRISRAGIDIIPYQGMELQFGDKVMVVGSEEAIQKVSNLLGNSMKKLHKPHILTMFLGIALGVLLGTLPLMNIPQPVKLGLASGPMLVAIFIGRFGTHWHLITYTTLSANLMLREIGLSLFLASVGLLSGGGFLSALISGGYVWIIYACLIALIPLLCVGIYARMRFHMDYYTILGTLSGSMTNPIALDYSNQQASSDMPSISYATVYPLVMFLRVVIAQSMILFLM
ncbi:MAG: putative transporter [Alistipes sp.]|nr:putative transporter [Candidatus Alistipes equi]